MCGRFLFLARICARETLETLDATAKAIAAQAHGE
jgi:hypothetical protein